MAKWKQGSAPADLLARLSEIRKVDSTGKVSFTGFAFDEYLSPLVHCIDFAAATPWHEKRSLCRAALFSHDADKSFDPRSFLTALAKCEHRLISRELKTFWVRTSVSIRGLQKPQHGSFQGASYRLLPTWPPLDKDAIRLLDRAQAHLAIAEPPKGYLAIWICSAGLDAYDSGFKALDAIDTIRGMWNFSGNRHHVRHSTGRRYPVNPITLGPVHMIFDRDKRVLEQWLYDPDFTSSNRTMDVAQNWIQIRSDERVIRETLRKTWHESLVLSAFRQYARALDDTRFDAAFLRLWAVFEQLTLTTRGASDRTITRASAVFDDPTIVRAQLEALRDGRNEYVHTNSPIDEPELSLYQLKSIVDGVFHFWFGAARRLKSEDEVRSFLEFSLSTATLRRKRAILDAAIRYRES